MATSTATKSQRMKCVTASGLSVVFVGSGATWGKTVKTANDEPMEVIPCEHCPRIHTRPYGSSTWCPCGQPIEATRPGIQEDQDYSDFLYESQRDEKLTEAKDDN